MNEWMDEWMCGWQDTGGKEDKGTVYINKKSRTDVALWKLPLRS